MKDPIVTSHEIVFKTVCKSKTGTHPDHGKPVVLVRFTFDVGEDRIIVGIGDTEQDAINDAIEQSKVPYIDARPLSADEI